MTASQEESCFEDGRRTSGSPKVLQKPDADAQAVALKAQNGIEARYSQQQKLAQNGDYTFLRDVKCPYCGMPQQFALSAKRGWLQLFGGIVLLPVTALIEWWLLRSGALNGVGFWKWFTVIVLGILGLCLGVGLIYLGGKELKSVRAASVAHVAKGAPTVSFPDKSTITVEFSQR